MYLPRTIEKEIPSLCQRFKVLLTTGMRQVGKSTLLSHLSEGARTYVTLDDAEERGLAENAPRAFFSRHPLPLFIDEIQRAPQLFLQLKAEVDRSDLMGAAWLSGSQRFSLMKGVGDSLAGRLFEIHLMPLSLYERFGSGLLQKPYLPSEEPAEVLSPRSMEETWSLIWQGGWPAVIALTPRERSQFYESFLSTFLDRDLRDLGSIEDLSVFRRFMKALALRTGQELRINKLSELTGVSDPTVKRWLRLAETAGLIYLLPPFFSNKTKTLVKSPKIYFIDTGLCAWLCGFSTAEEMHRDTNAGAFFETFVVSEILKSWRHNGLEPELYFYRDAKKQSEIDLLIHAEGKWHPVGIKMSEHPERSMIRHFSELSNMDLEVGCGAVICSSDSVRFLKDDVVAHSVWNL